MTLKLRPLTARFGTINYSLVNLRGDVLGGITAGVVLIPVAMAYGAFSGLGPVAGLWGSIAVGFFAAMFGGTRGLISGPNMFTTIVMAVVVAEYANSLAEAMTVVILAGLFQVVFGFLRLGSFASYTSYSALSGFFTATGILFIAIQLLPFLGSPAASGGVIGAVRALPHAVSHVNFDALAVGAITLLLTVFWRGRIIGLVPAATLALVVGTAAGVFWFHDAPVIGGIPSKLPSLQLPALSVELLTRALEPALIIALLGSISTLLVALVVDSITGDRHNSNRELVGQGIGNLAAGFLGGMPGAVNAATYINIRIGGRSPVAGIAAALVLLAAVIGLASMAERVPWAVLAALLIKVGWDFIDWRFIMRIHRISRDHVAVMLITLLLALWIDFITAIVVGLVVSGFVNARRMEAPEARSLISVPLLDRNILAGEEIDEYVDPFEARVGLIAFPDRVSVASAREVIRIAGPDISGHQIVIFDFSRTVYVDDTAASVIGELVNIAVVAQSKPCVISGLTGDVARTLQGLGTLDRVPRENFVSGLDEAKQIVRPLLDSR